VPKNEWGQKMVKKINHILLEERPKKQYTDALFYWNTDEDKLKLESIWSQLIKE